MRVIYFSNQPAPYQELLSIFLIKEIEFKFIYLNTALKGRNRDWAKILGNNHFIGNNSIRQEISKFQPDIVVFLGVFKKELFHLIFLKLFFRFRLVIFSEVMRNHRLYRYRNPIIVYSYLKLISPFVDSFLCGNEYVKFQFELANIDSNKLRLINYPIIHLKKVKRANTLDENKPNYFRVLHANRLEKLNNPKEIIRQFDIIKQYRNNAILYLFEEGSLFDEISNLVGERQDIIFFSNKKYDELDGFYSTFDVFLNARSFGSGNNGTIEAMCQGVIPVIHMGTVGAREQILNGITGFGYHKYDDFEESFVSYCSASENSIDRIKNNNQYWVKRSPELLSREYIELFNSL